jgi:hypothetical protein
MNPALEALTEKTMKGSMRDELAAPKLVDRNAFEALLDLTVYGRAGEVGGLADRLATTV